MTYLVAFNTTNMHIYHKEAIGHLMQAWARFSLQCYSFYMYFTVLALLVGTPASQGKPVIYCSAVFSWSRCFLYISNCTATHKGSSTLSIYLSYYTKRTNYWNTTLDQLQVQSKFKDIVALEPISILEPINHRPSCRPTVFSIESWHQLSSNPVELT